MTARYSDSTIGAMLGHAGGTITSRYVHHLDAVLVAAADRVSERIASLNGSANTSCYNTVLDPGISD